MTHIENISYCEHTKCIMTHPVSGRYGDESEYVIQIVGRRWKKIGCGVTQIVTAVRI